jgi:hypothetical protein
LRGIERRERRSERETKRERERKMERGEGSVRRNSYMFYIDVGSIPHQNLHNFSFTLPSCKV